MDFLATENLKKDLIQGISRGEIEQASSLTRNAADSGALSPQILGNVMGKACAFLYDNFFVDGVEQYYKTVFPYIQGDILESFKVVMEERFRLTHEWMNKLSNLYVERMARDIQDAIRAREYDLAGQLCLHLVRVKGTGEPNLERAALLGNIFGTLENIQDQVEDVMQRLCSLFPERIMQTIRVNQKERLALIYKSQMENRGQEWQRNLTIATAEIKRYLPLSTVAGEPDPSDIEKFDLLIRSIVRCYYMPPYALDDILNLLVELRPHEVSAAGAASGMESRLYNALNPTQKKVVIEVLTLLGKNRSFVKEIVKFGRANQGARRQQIAIEILGGLKAEKAADYLIECLQDKKGALMRPVVIDSLGSLVRQDVRVVLLDLLRTKIQAKSIGPQIREEISHILLALAKISRNVNLSKEERNALIRDVIQILDDKDSRINLICAENLFLSRQDEIEKDLRAWCVERLTEGLWLRDTSPDFAQGTRAGESSQRTLLGQRETIVDLISQLGPEFLPSVIKASEIRMIHYGSAYLAVAEIMSRMGDERAVPLLDKILNVTMTTDENEIGKYEREHYWDNAGETLRILEKDKIVHGIVYALNKIGGEAADRVVEGLYHKFQSGEYPIPGKETGDLVFRIYQRIEEGRGEQSDKNVSGNVQMTITREMIEEAIKILKKSFIFSNSEKRRMQKVGALQLLGSAKDPVALWDIIPQLEDKDSLVAASAMAAIVGYNAPPMGMEKLRRFLHVLVSSWESGSFDLRQKIEKIISGLQPERDAMKGKIREAIETESDHKIRFYMEKLFVDHLAPRGKDKEEAEEEQIDNAETSETGKASTANIAAWERKRLYLEARRKWIAGGKDGDPPNPADF
ncbi:hypothetical protein JW926_13315 [Candidatus Sumerlaeota bacterium]|nr:hypothetical protein [Candidatus Sumerlaeota bacterium]